MEWRQFNKGVFLVNVLGIVYNRKTRKILIGRREKDPYVKELTWCFPGGRVDCKLDVEACLKKEIKKKTGVNVEVKSLIFARISKENKKILLIYYYCETEKENAKAGEKFVEVKWVKPLEVKRYFTTSLHPKVIRFLKALK
jgi:ADP-ribose pyrophosphatase YjhB (NUDIX family)